MATVNAPYSAQITPDELAAKLTDLACVAAYDCAVFAFLSEVSPTLQQQFISEMEIDPKTVALIANRFSALAGYKLPLAA